MVHGGVTGRHRRTTPALSLFSMPPVTTEPCALGAMMRERREELEWTQTRLANETGFKPQTISEWESGKRPPSLKALIAIGDALELDMSELARAVVADDEMYR